MNETLRELRQQAFNTIRNAFRNYEQDTRAALQRKSTLIPENVVLNAARRAHDVFLDTCATILSTDINQAPNGSVTAYKFPKSFTIEPDKVLLEFKTEISFSHTYPDANASDDLAQREIIANGAHLGYIVKAVCEIKRGAHGIVDLSVALTIPPAKAPDIGFGSNNYIFTARLPADDIEGGLPSELKSGLIVACQRAAQIAPLVSMNDYPFADSNDLFVTEKSTLGAAILKALREAIQQTKTLRAAEINIGYALWGYHYATQNADNITKSSLVLTYFIGGTFVDVIDNPLGLCVLVEIPVTYHVDNTDVNAFKNVRISVTPVLRAAQQLNRLIFVVASVPYTGSPLPTLTETVELPFGTPTTTFINTIANKIKDIIVRYESQHIRDIPQHMFFVQAFLMGLLRKLRERARKPKNENIKELLKTRFPEGFDMDIVTPIGALLRIAANYTMRADTKQLLETTTRVMMTNWQMVVDAASAPQLESLQATDARLNINLVATYDAMLYADEMLRNTELYKQYLSKVPIWGGDIHAKVTYTLQLARLSWHFDEDAQIVTLAIDCARSLSVQGVKQKEGAHVVLPPNIEDTIPVPAPIIARVKLTNPQQALEIAINTVLDMIDDLLLQSYTLVAVESLLYRWFYDLAERNISAIADVVREYESAQQGG
ncbi:MAG: hypothetical protein QW230_01650 [Thermofilum sp.]